MENQHKKKIGDNSILVTMDVRSLYTNIPNKEGIEALETTLKIKNVGTRIISTFLQLVLTLNNLIFNYENYLQIEGCSMGTNVHQATQIHLWVCSKKETYIFLLKQCLSFTHNS